MAIRSGRVGVRPDQVDAYGRIKNSGGGGIDVDAALSTTSTNPVQNRVITNALNEKVNANSLAEVATTGDFDDLFNKPTIPTKTSELQNDSGFITSVPVTSVNGKTGAVSLNASDVGAIPSGTSFVTSVNGNTGSVVLDAEDVGALPSDTSYVSSVNGSTGDVTVHDLPTGGATGRLLEKNSPFNYSVKWSNYALTDLMVVVVSQSSISTLPVTLNNLGNITSSHVLLNYELSNPSAQTGDWIVTTSNGSVTISGSISGSTDIKLYFGRQRE